MPLKKTLWSTSVINLIKLLHSELVLKENDWHKLKNEKSRRAAELLVSALSQIVNDGKESDIEELILQSLKWVKGEVQDPGCPSR